MLRTLLRRSARSGVRLTAYYALAGIGLVRRRFVRVLPASADPRRILVIRVDLLGDVLFSVQAVKALRARYPDAYIAMLTLPYTAPLARLYGEVDEVIAVDTNRIRTLRGLADPRTWRGYVAAYRKVRDRKFDVAIGLSGRMGSLLAFLSGSGRTYGYADEAYPGLLTDPVPGGRYLDRVHEVEYNLRLARAAGAETRPDHLSIPVPDCAVENVRRLLTSNGISRDDSLLVIHAGSINGSAKRWPASNWAEFARSVGDRSGVKIALAGAASDTPMAIEVLQGSPHVVNLVGRTSVEDLVALVERADLVATGDSGPLHLAVALGVPLLAVYGPTDPRIHGPYRPIAPVRLHRYDLPCSPCYTMAATAECPLGDPICMRLVTVDAMVESALGLLGRDRSRLQPAKTSF